MAFSTFTYGGYTSVPGAASFTINKTTIIGGTGCANLVHHQYIINSRLQGTDAADIAAQIAALEGELIDGQDLTFSLGGHGLSSAACTEGTHVRRLTWLKGYDGVHGSGAEFVNRRSFQIVIDGLIPLTAATDVVAWSETLIPIGTGAPSIVPVTSLAGAVQPQQTVAYTPYYLIQSGFGIGLTVTPVPSTPLWANGVAGIYWHNVDRWKLPTIATPTKWGINQNLYYKTEWSYQFWSAGLLTGSPIVPFF